MFFLLYVLLDIVSHFARFLSYRCDAIIHYQFRFHGSSVIPGHCLWNIPRQSPEAKFWRTLGLVVIIPSYTPVSRRNRGLVFDVDCTTKNSAVTFVSVVRLQMFAMNCPARYMGDVWAYAFSIVPAGCSCMDTALVFAIALY